MAGPDGFRDPFEASAGKNPSAIGSGRGRNGSDNNSTKVDGHSPTSRSELQPNRAAGDPAAVLIRMLAASMTKQTLRSMLLFSRDCEDCEFIASTSVDEPFKTAIARFRSSDGAHQARELLNGRSNEDGVEMKVEVINLTPGGSVSKQLAHDGNTSDGITSRSRFGDAFRDVGGISPPMNDSSRQTNDVDGYSPTSGPAGLSAQSPIGHAPRYGVSGRSMIQQDETDDETTKILHDPAGFLSQEQQQMLFQRRFTAPTIPSNLADRFGGLHINSGVGSNGISSPLGGMVSPRGFGGSNGTFPFSPNNTGHGARGSISHAASPTSRYPPGISSPVGGFQGRPGQFFPPVNPADQNPPCNTLYVGNLPMDTSEDELKALFSKQRGYKRLCFRTKQNGPMCFVEFEEIQWATRALNELYGHPLSNSVRGGIRLSFSKNPLGVRGPAAQSPVSAGPGNYAPGGVSFNQAVLSPQYGNVNPQSFSTASGPPPGLPTPQGYQSTRSNGTNGTFTNGRDVRDNVYGNHFNGR